MTKEQYLKSFLNKKEVIDLSSGEEKAKNLQIRQGRYAGKITIALSGSGIDADFHYEDVPYL